MRIGAEFWIPARYKRFFLNDEYLENTDQMLAILLL
jgi:hypothetical protein